jgi:hypothetical protein
MSTKKKAAWYAVWRGVSRGVYTTWKECEDQVKTYSDAGYKKYETEIEAHMQMQEEICDWIIPQHLRRTDDNMASERNDRPDPANNKQASINETITDRRERTTMAKLRNEETEQKYKMAKDQKRIALKVENDETHRKRPCTSQAESTVLANKGTIYESDLLPTLSNHAEVEQFLMSLPCTNDLQFVEITDSEDECNLHA